QGNVRDVSGKLLLDHPAQQLAARRGDLVEPALDQGGGGWGGGVGKVGSSFVSRGGEPVHLGGGVGNPPEPVVDEHRQLARALLRPKIRVRNLGDGDVEPYLLERRLDVGRCVDVICP